MHELVASQACRGGGERLPSFLTAPADGVVSVSGAPLECIIAVEASAGL